MDASEVWGAARTAQQIAGEVRGLAGAARTDGRAEGWVSVAADEFRRLLAAELDRVLAAGVLVDRAAEALFAHAGAVRAAGRDGRWP